MQGKPFPSSIDKQFADIAQRKVDSSFLKYRVWLPLQRMLIFWLAPHPSFGWPIELDTQITKELKAKLLYGSIAERSRVFIENYKVLTGKILLFFYRLILLLLVVFLFSKMLKHGRQQIKNFVVNLIIFSIVRSCLLSYQTSIDNRYMITAIAAIEIALPLMFYSYLTPKCGSQILQANRAQT